LLLVVALLAVVARPLVVSHPLVVSRLLFVVAVLVVVADSSVVVAYPLFVLVPPPLFVIMKCGVCHFVSGPDEVGHTARTCPLKQVECRRSLKADHPFAEPGQCLRGNCVHAHSCNTCGKKGHQYGTQALTPTRWQLNKKGRLVRKQGSKVLTKADFFCTLMTEVSIKSMIANSQNVSTAAAQLDVERRNTVSRLRGNVNAGKMNVDETVRVMQGMGSDAAVLDAGNMPVFKTLVDSAHLGAVEAGYKAAAAVESEVEGDDNRSSELEALDQYDADDAEGVADPPVGASATRRVTKKPLRVHRGGAAGRTADYAAAVFKGRRPRGASAAASNSKGSKSSRRSGGSLQPDGQDIPSMSRATEDNVGAVGPGPREGDWPAGTRARFEKTLPSFVSRPFASTPPVRFAHLVLGEFSQGPVEDVELEVAGAVTKASLAKHIRGYVLTSGTLCPAVVSDWLCSQLPPAMRTTMLSSIACAVEAIVHREASTVASDGSQAGGPPDASTTLGTDGRGASTTPTVAF